ncbi:tyrosine-type recombinase/integrase [Erwinia pyrifoliae]|uniref:tyrosine-type recombinase/integrase n=1 Tax=Erwinia pyrifoliae TaxID=79967 RepID=UPI0034D96865
MRASSPGRPQAVALRHRWHGGVEASALAAERAAGRWRTTGRRQQLRRVNGDQTAVRWLLQRHVILYNPAELLALPERRLPAQVFSEAETRRVLQSLDAGTPPGLRNRAILELLWSSGIRRSELAGLLLSDVDFTRGVSSTCRRGKGGKDRVVPVGRAA